MNNEQIKFDAVVLFSQLDQLIKSGYVQERTADALADFWVESQFARVDIECDWDEDKCDRMHKRMVKQLQALGLR